MNSEEQSVSPLSDIIQQRRTIHNFQPEIPPRDTILRSIELACWAPNHHHTEPWRFFLLGPDAKAQVVNLNAELITARKGREAGDAKRRRWSTVPGWLAVLCPRSEDPQREQEDYAACCCAVQNFSLLLWEQNIGVKWTTGDVTRDPRFFEILAVSFEDYVNVGLLWYGYAEDIPKQSRQPVGDVLTELP